MTESSATSQAASRKKRRRIARLFRVWAKKRGKRLTGSKLFGSVGEALFSATLCLLGILSLLALLAWSSPYTPGFGFWVMVLVLSSFVLLGGGGVIWTLLSVGASPERRSALAQQAPRIDLAEGDEAVRERLPCIPSDANLTNSPGVTLRYRLPIVQSPAWRLMFASVFCLIWNFSAGLLVWFAAKSFVVGEPEWFLTMFTIPFLAISAWSIRDFVRQWVIQAVIGPTNVEVSDHPLRPGRSYQFYLSQAGRLSMKSLALDLVCEEAVSYRQGTDVRSETRTVFDRQIYRWTDFKIDPGLPFEHELVLDIPAQAMHSFQSEHNAVNWRLEVRGVPEAWPPFQRSFPLIVHPRDDGDHRTPDRTANSQP